MKAVVLTGCHLSSLVRVVVCVDARQHDISDTCEQSEGHHIFSDMFYDSRTPQVGNCSMTHFGEKGCHGR